ncbi:hypothetical protein WJX72_003194 [[Myrmecia] bisecta]|uniref:Cytochrome b5 domain-containing protein 1 n=1 Tax=[Myrmecia] bisecta TaxID=41462 RepID=A0AAW1P8R4_9CHLO
MAVLPSQLDHSEPQLKRRRYYTPAEVALHNSPRDCWVSFLGGVYDVTDLIQAEDTPAAQPIIDAAGTDVSHWFDAETGDVRMHVDVLTNLNQPYCPQGRFTHVAPAAPAADWDTSFGRPWWQDPGRWRIGALTSRTRVVRIKNVLTEQEDRMEVPQEETLEEVQNRYQELNAHTQSYIWKALRTDPYRDDLKADFAELDMSHTLAENGVLDESADFEEVGLQSECYIPVLHVYWTDDLTVA